jgi:hypothetical protein
VRGSGDTGTPEGQMSDASHGGHTPPQERLGDPEPPPASPPSPDAGAGAPEQEAPAEDATRPTSPSRPFASQDGDPWPFQSSHVSGGGEGPWPPAEPEQESEAEEGERRRWRPSWPALSFPVSRPELLWAAITACAVAAVGLPLAFLWAALGPHVDIVMTAPGRPDLTDYNTEAFVAGDGRYAAITALAGAVAGGVAWSRSRVRGPVMVIGLAIGALAGAWITWKLGTEQGLDEFRRLLATAETGQRFEQNMRLRAIGLVFLEPIVAVSVYVICAAWSRYPDLIPPRGGEWPADEPAEFRDAETRDLQAPDPDEVRAQGGHQT